MTSVTIRVWKGPTVCAVLTVSESSQTFIGAVGGAGNSTRADIELDPWANLIVDNRAEYPAPVPIRSED